jgi:hypothetical protein
MTLREYIKILDLRTFCIAIIPDTHPDSKIKKIF